MHVRFEVQTSATTKKKRVVKLNIKNYKNLNLENYAVIILKTFF